MLVVKPAHASTTFTVINTNDTGAGSLRQAITDANNTSGADVINFNIAGTGVHTIAPESALPQITEAVTIDGYSQPGAKPNTKAVGSDAVLKIELRASVNRARGRMKNGHEMFHHAGSSLRFPNGRSMSRARTPTIPHRTHLGAVLGPPARAKDELSARMPPLAHPREGRLREAGPSPGVRMRLRKDRRRLLLGEHAASQAG